MDGSPRGRKESDTTERLHFLSRTIYLLGEGLGCGFLQTVKDDSNENSLSGKGEHCMDSQAVV